MCSLHLSKHLGKVSLFLGVWGIYYMCVRWKFYGSLKLLWPFSFCLILSQFCYIFVFTIFYAVKKYTVVPLCSFGSSKKQKTKEMLKQCIEEKQRRDNWKGQESLWRV